MCNAVSPVFLSLVLIGVTPGCSIALVTAAPSDLRTASRNLYVSENCACAACDTAAVAAISPTTSSERARPETNFNHSLDSVTRHSPIP
jgi:hypothetical protein